LKHDPEKAAASYLSGEMKQRRRVWFERHIVECEDCWHEVQTGRAGRSIAESGRELAPQEIREQVRAVIAAAPIPNRRWAWRWGTTVFVVALIAMASVAYVALEGRNQPRVIDAVLIDYRDGSPSGEAIEALLPRRLGDLAYARSYADTLGGLDVSVHVYRDTAGHTVRVYQSDRTFPVADGAEHGGDGRTWTAAADGVVLFCADHPVPSLVVGDDAREVALAVRELGLR
jgi:anti-sigma factor RsiW